MPAFSFLLSPPLFSATAGPIFYETALVKRSDTLNRVDETGMKQGYWVVFNNNKKLPAYPEDAKVEEGFFADSRKTGIWKVYYPSGKIKGEITYKDNRPSGYAKIYYEDGTIMEEGVWQNNKWTGKFQSYHENGKTFMDFNYNAGGKRQGEQKYFYDNGQLMMKGEMSEGKETGTWAGYYENGDKREEKVFNDGALDAAKTKTYEPPKELAAKKETVTSKPATKPIDTKTEQPNPVIPFDGNGYAKLFNLNKQISKDGVFRNYRLIDGKDYIYGKEGFLEKIAMYKDGKYIGETPIEEKDKENNELVIPNR